MTSHEQVLSLLVPAAVVLGCAALAARPAGGPGAVAVAVVVGTIGALGPSPSDAPTRRPTARWLMTVAVGIGAFAAARALSPMVTPVTLAAVAITSVAEEVFFRRLVYGWLAALGPGLAVAGAAAAFAAVHLPAWGMAAVPLNLAAGLLFGWQRWATGGWSASALTHIVANLFQLG